MGTLANTHSFADVVVVAHSSLSIQIMAKAMRAAMKGMRRRAMKKSVIAKGKRARVSVFRGSKVKTSSGLKKSDLTKSKSGNIVSKAASAAGKKAYKNISGWTNAVKKARKQLKCRGFVAVKKGSALYKLAKDLYGK